MNAQACLRVLKALHTLIWAFFASCVVAIPIAAWLGNFRAALVLIGLVGIECLVLAMNAGNCPLQAIAARYTADRQPNFDIYLPEWLASRTKSIFGPLFGLGLMVTLGLWLLRG